MKNLMIKELRYSTGLTQKKFSELYGIPLRTLQKWEQGESSPPGYVLSMIAESLPACDEKMEKITGREGKIFYYDKNGRTVSDTQGNRIRISESLDGVNKGNLILYLEDLFDGFYALRERFERDCRFDREDNITWTR